MYGPSLTPLLTLLGSVLDGPPPQCWVVHRQDFTIFRLVTVYKLTVWPPPNRPIEAVFKALMGAMMEVRPQTAILFTGMGLRGAENGHRWTIQTIRESKDKQRRC